jgi:aryl carrier-like protein
MTSWAGGEAPDNQNGFELPPWDADEDTGYETYSASFGQHRLWFMQQLEPGSATYSVPLAVRLSGELDAGVLQRAVDVLVSRHEVLRTCLAEHGGLPEQVVSGECRVPVELFDFSPVPDAGERERRIAALVADVAAQPFDLAVAPLLRVVLARAGPREHVLVLNMHHAVTDGSSFGVLGRELSALYAAFQSGRDAGLAALPVQYGDFAEWQRDAMSAGRWSDQLDFWRRELKDWPAVLDLPSDHPRPAVRTSRGAAVELCIPAGTAAAVRGLSRELGGTVHMVLMTAFQAFLHQLTGQERFLVGTAVAGRRAAVVEDLIGFFVNTLPVRADFTGSPSFAEAFARVQRSLLDAYANQDVPLDQIVQAVGPPRDPSRTPLFQAILTYGPDPLSTLHLPGTAAGSYALALSQGAHSDVDVVIYDDGETLTGFVQYPQDILDEGTASRWRDELLAMLSACMAAPGRPLARPAHTPLLPTNGLPDACGAAPGVGLPRNETARLVAEVWTGALGKAQVTPDEDLFQGGGDSLLAMLIVNRVEAVTGRKVPIGDFLRQPTVSAMASLVDSAGQPDPGPGPRPREDHSSRPSASFGQHRLWFMQQLEPGSATYSVPLAVRLSGELDAGVLQRAVDVLVSRHEVLRTCLAEHGGLPEQVVSGECRVPVELFDFSPVPDAGERERRIAALVADVAAQPFDLAVAPLLRVVLARAGPREHVLVLNMHHAVTDGSSFGVLGRELSALYAAFQSGRDAGLAALPVQYGDFAEWQRDAMSAGRWSDQLDFWRRELKDWPAVLDLPSDHPRPAVRTSRGAAVELCIPAGTAAAVRGLSRELGGTVHMVLMTAFQAFLHQLTGQERFLVGTAVAGRRAAVVEDLIGFFVNTLPVRADFTGSPSFAEAFARVQRSLLDAYANQDVPLDQIVQAVGPPRDPSRTPLFQAILTYGPDPLSTLHLPGTAAQHYPVLQQAARCDINMEITCADDLLRAVIEYSTELFERVTIECHFATFLQLLERARPAPGIPGKAEVEP